MLGDRFEDLHLLARKLVTLSRDELQACADNDGKLSMILFAPAMVAAIEWIADSQDVESFFNMIKSEIRRSPGSKLPHVDAQVGNRLAMSFASGERRMHYHPS